MLSTVMMHLPTGSSHSYLLSIYSLLVAEDIKVNTSCMRCAYGVHGPMRGIQWSNNKIQMDNDKLVKAMEERNSEH